MAHLIDKDALVAEIEKRLDEIYPTLPNASDVEKGDSTLSGAYVTGRYNALESFSKFINTLEVKEVDLEKETEKYLRTFSSSPDNGIEYSKKLARHFFELGMQVSNKAQKGENI